MRPQQIGLITSITTSILITSLLSPQNHQITSASAELFAPDLPDANTSTSIPVTDYSWHHAAWEHWGSAGLDPQHAPYAVVFVGSKLQNIEQNDIATTIQTAINTWNNVSCAVEQLRFAGFRTTMSDLSPHEIPIFIPTADYWVEQSNLIASANMNNPAIALNTAHFTWSLEPAPFQYLSPDHESNAPVAPRIVDLQSVLTHELGHILGLWHTHSDATASMTAKYLPDANQRTLAADDKFGLCHLYPKPGTNPECTHNNDCPDGSCITDNTFHVCQKAQANPGDFCALDLLHCPHGCIIDDASTGTGYCTQQCQTNTDCPDHFVCKQLADQNTCVVIRPDAAEKPNPTTSCAISTQHSAPHPIPAAALALLSAVLWTRNSRQRRKTTTPT